VGTESFPNTRTHNWRLVEKHPYVIGDFVWTGMDHLGESSIGNAQWWLRRGAEWGLAAPAHPRAGPGPPPAAAGSPGQAPGGGGLGTVFTGPITLGNINLGFPWFNCYCGDIDLIGEAKPQWYLRKVLWGMSKLEMAVQRPLPAGRNETISAWGWSDELRSWTWPGYEGRTLRVRVYSSGDRVRLLVNGKEIGEKAVGEDTGRMAEFEAPYEAGELKAVALAGGSQIAEQAFKTVGPPARLRLRADRAAIRRTPGDLAYVTIEVLDKAGELVPDAVAPVTLAVTGSCELAAAGSANPKDVLSFRSPHPKTFHGRALAILRPRAGVVGPATLRATAAGLAPATAVIRVS
jgi:beta-galactosidase